MEGGGWAGGFTLSHAHNLSHRAYLYPQSLEGGSSDVGKGNERAGTRKKKWKERS